MRLIKIVNVIRYNDWWLYKVPTLVAIFYATLNLAGLCIADCWIELVKLLFYIGAAAIYVSIINDVTDKKLDEDAGKANFFIKLPPTYQSIIVASTVVLQIIVLIILSKYTFAVVFYLLSISSYSLYSIPPFRFKLNRYLGILTDALGAHCFASLFLLTYTCEIANINVEYNWLVVLAVWSLSYGIRGIFWHQFIDKDADFRTGVMTLANTLNTKKINAIVLIVFMIETIFLLYIMYYFKSWLVVIFLLFYLLVAFTRHFLYRSKIILARPTSRHFQILFSEYYEFYLPISLLILNTQICSTTLFIVLLQLLLFPKIIVTMFVELKDIIRRLLRYLNTFNRS